MKKTVALIASALLVVALGSLALAHAEIESCTPPIDGTVETAPDRLVCQASQGMKSEGSLLQVFDANGVQVDKGDSQVDLNDPDRVTISVSLDTSKMTDGVYTVKWTTVSADDGDEDSGEFHFTVGHAMHDETTATPDADSKPEITHPNDDPTIGQVTLDGKQITLTITAPPKDATLPSGDVTVEATVEGITLGENGAHLHFSVDGKLATMGEGAQTSATFALEPGEHEIEVTLADDMHEDLVNAHVHVMVEEAAVQATATLTSEATSTTQAQPTATVVQATATQAATATAAPTLPPAPTATAIPTTLPATGSGIDNSLLVLIGVLGVLLVGGTALVIVRARK